VAVDAFEVPDMMLHAIGKTFNDSVFHDYSKEA
jgi:hypothetical protein